MKPLWLILFVLLIIGISCSTTSEISNKENFINWLKDSFNKDMLKGNYFPAGKDNYYLAKDIEIKSWETYEDGSKGAEAVIIAYPLSYFESTLTVQDSLLKLKSFHSVVNVEYAICYSTKSHPVWGLLIGSWDVDKINDDSTENDFFSNYLSKYWGGYENKNYYKECQMEALNQHFLYLQKNASSMEQN